jgi:tetratricopeptide (TPR) repeat protein
VIKRYQKNADQYPMALDCKLIAELIEAGLDELLAMRRTDEIPRPLALYRAALIAFHQGNIGALDEQLRSPRLELGDPDDAGIRDLIALRRALLGGETDLSWLSEMSSPVLPTPPHWQGEKCILIAYLYTTRGDHGAAMAWFKKSIAGLRRIGAVKKVLRAEMSLLVAISNLEPERKFLSEYYSIYRSAVSIGEVTSAATCLLNLSREYQKMKAYQVALKFCNQGLKLAEEIVGSQIYFLLLAHRCHLFWQLGREREAEVDLEMIQTSDHPEVRGACQILLEIVGKSGEQADSKVTLLPNWKERRDEHYGNEGRLPARIKGRRSRDETKPLGAQEEKLIQFLSEQPRDKFEIGLHLFGERIDPLVAENRLKQLIFRVRKKIPGIINMNSESGRYSISDINRIVRRAK